MSFVDQRVIAQRMAKKDARLRREAFRVQPCPVRGEDVMTFPLNMYLKDACRFRALFMGATGESKARD